jgi:hypothetical protein
MGWIEKHKPATFENLPIHGLVYLDGDMLARLIEERDKGLEFPIINPQWLKGQKFPMVEFPSGERFDLWETNDEARGGIVHIFGEMDLPIWGQNRDEAYAQADDISSEVGYIAHKRGEIGLEVIGYDRGEHYLITYDNTQRHIINIQPLTVEQPIPVERPPLLDAESRQRLPKLRATEHQGVNAVAQVKFFIPGGWIWYASEFDGEDIFFGLVIGFETEFGIFSLAELNTLHGGTGQAVERDTAFQPTTFAKLLEKHKGERNDF